MAVPTFLQQIFASVAFRLENREEQSRENSRKLPDSKATHEAVGLFGVDLDPQRFDLQVSRDLDAIHKNLLDLPMVLLVHVF